MFRLFILLKPYKSMLALAAICLLLGAPAQLFHPLVWRFIVDELILSPTPRFIEIVGGEKLTLLLAALGVMFAVHAVGVALGSLRSWILGTVGQRFVYDLRSKVYRRLQEQTLAFYHKRSTGDIIARTIGDVDSLETVAIRGTDEVLSNIVQFLCVAGIILWLQPVVGALTLTPMLGVVLLVRVFNSRVKGVYRQVRDRLGEVSAKVHENVTGMVVVKSFGQEQRESERFDRVNRQYMDVSMKAVIARALYFPSVSSVGFISNLVMIGVGAWFVILGKFTVGGLVAYRAYWWQLFSPVNSLAQINEMLQRASAAAARVFEILDEPVAITDKPGATKLANVRGEVRFEQVDFAYDTRRRTIESIDLHVQPGHSLGVVGPSGAGKSTLLSIVLRLYEPAKGRVLVDGMDIRDVTQSSLRQHFAIVTQEPFLFNDTIRNNIIYGHANPQDVTDEMCEQAARLANAHDFIEGLPEGYATVVGERGVRLSGGQKQRICIARALLADPRILLLDEATASVEPESESIIQAAVQNLMKGRTAIIVSHRLSMVRDCNELVVIEDGRITERGSHDELMSADGWYARMYRLQMGHHV